MDSYHNELTDKLMETICRLKSKEDCYNFFDDVCTIKEVMDMSKRLEAAKLLDKKLSYQEIIEKVGLSTATLSRVSKALNYGAGGYKKVLEKSKK